MHVSTNEENEEEFLKLRAKLYRFDSKAEPAEWKERGTGELKILRHKENNSFRIVMRRDKTLKVCANHFITPWMELKPNATNEKAFIYTVLADFADEQPKSECLAVKFGSVENANIFKTKFEDAKKILVTKCSLYTDDHDEDEDNDDEVKVDAKETLKCSFEDSESICKDLADGLSQLEVSKTSISAQED